ncbi:multiple C2 domain and transmembrane region protein 16 [Cornus florida]|uniref:multiple C2 domain and transmembrane region protein 16 n=1 Tax=Cornus florida TaxID=4283 RepID=UPI0028995F46|nr:multiple C2 domain and transmembrane region protein 16 [Cornus florida]
MDPVRKLIVQVVDARELLPKDGHGSTSPYVVLNFYGQKKRTRTVIGDLNPTWNEKIEFNVDKRPSSVIGDLLEVDVYHYHDRSIGPTTKDIFLGRLRLSSRQFVKKGEEALIYYPLEKKSLFSWVRGEIGLKIYFVEPVSPPSPPPSAEDVKPPDAAPPPPPPVEPGSDTQQPKEDAVADGAKSDTQAVPPPEPNQAPAADPPPDGGKPSEDIPPPAGTETAEKPPEPDPQPQDASTVPVDPVPAPSVQPDPSQPQMTASLSSRSGPEFGFNGPQPISRHASVSSFMSDPSEGNPIERTSFDLVDKMHYLFVRVLKARSLHTNSNPIVKIAASGSQVVSKPARRTQLFEWDQTFAFGHDTPDSSSSILEISLWDAHNFLGGLCFDVTEIPLRDPPDSPLAPQWYRLEGGGVHGGHLMLATWLGTQADEAFPEAWKTDTAGNPTSQSKVYQSPKLWYLRLRVIEAQDIMPLTSSKESSIQVKAKLGFQVFKTKPSVTRNGSPSWNEDLIFVAAEPFSDQHLVLYLESRQAKGPVILGVTSIQLTSIERRVDDRKVASRWFNFDKGRVQLCVCFDGGYHVMDEAAHVCSDYRPTARQLWKPPVGMVELGIVGCKNLVPMKTINGKGSTDAYAVVKYGNKWVCTRSISDSLEPRWNEQYTWKVYDPSTVLTIGVFQFDSLQLCEMDGSDEPTRNDHRMGKVRIRISTLETGKVYKNTYPLLLLSNIGLKKMGEIEVAVRLARVTPTLDFLHVYSQPLLPLMHHIKPLGMIQQEILRTTTVKLLAAHFSRSEPPLPQDVITYMLDAESHAFSMRKVRANWFRIINVVAGVIDVVKWLDDTRAWKNPTATILVHALLVMLVWFPDLIVPTFAFYLFVIGAWNYRFRSRIPLPHFDPKISFADSIDGDELDEEFDAVPSSRPNEMVRARYDKLRSLGARVQTILGDFATQAERVQALVTWRDPRGTGIFVGLCFVVAMILYLVPSKMVAMAFGFYYLRHPLFRDRMPSPALNFFRRLPSLSDRIL